MKRLALAFGFVLCLGGVVSVQAPPGHVVWDDDGHPVHVLPTRSIAHSSAVLSEESTDTVQTGEAQVFPSQYAGENLTDHGRLHLANAGVVAVYWNTAVANLASTSGGYSTVKNQIDAFISAFSDSSNWRDVATADNTITRQYGSTAAIRPALANRGSYVDAQATQTTISDAAIRSYLASLFSAGALTARSDTIYASSFRRTCRFTAGSDASCTQFCDCHSSFLYAGLQIKYASMPYGNCSGCNLTGAPDTGVITVVGAKGDRQIHQRGKGPAHLGSRTDAAKPVLDRGGSSRK